SYGDTFVSAIGKLYDGLKDSGARFVGSVATDGYSFSDSEAVVDGRFVGLPLDDVNEPDLTGARIGAWLEELNDCL
ncbi:MAG: flavodoxin, partial [Prevotella sp.]|nr:flavodoxin [Prevotella sp.]